MDTDFYFVSGARTRPDFTGPVPVGSLAGFGWRGAKPAGLPQSDFLTSADPKAREIKVKQGELKQIKVNQGRKKSRTAGGEPMGGGGAGFTDRLILIGGAIRASKPRLTPEGLSAPETNRILFHPKMPILRVNLLAKANFFLYLERTARRLLFECRRCTAKIISRFLSVAPCILVEFRRKWRILDSMVGRS